MTDLEAPARASYAQKQGRVGDWMQTVSGKMFWPMDPRPEEVDIEDVAHALSMLCRFGGHCNTFYSVAQHSVYVSYVVPPEFALMGLLHDAGEAYCVDMPRPIKRHLAGYRDIESRVWRAIADRFGVPYQLPECVHLADNAMLLAEKAQLLRAEPAPWSVPGQPADITIYPMSPKHARDVFMGRFAELMR